MILNKKNINNKAFTLVELLAVIIILSLLALITSTSITKILKESKDDLYQTQILSIKAAAETWGTNNVGKLPAAGDCKYITLKDLKDSGIMDSDIRDPRNNKEMSDDLKIKITSSTSKFGTLITNYEVNPKSVDGCSLVYKIVGVPVTESNKTAGKVPQGNFELGDEYVVNVDGTHEYHFYILSTEDEKVNLIMSRNICSDGTLATETNKCTVAWLSKADYNDDTNYGDVGNNNKGPITALNYLYQATSNWNNIDNIEIDYINEGMVEDYGWGYREIKTTGNITSITMIDGTESARYENLKVRMPMKKEIETAGCSDQQGSCPLWMVNGLQEFTSAYPAGAKESINGILGYWSLSGFSSNNGLVVFPFGTLNGAMISDNGYRGVRPVISVLKSDLSQ